MVAACQASDLNCRGVYVCLNCIDIRIIRIQDHIDAMHTTHLTCAKELFWYVNLAAREEAFARPMVHP